jgi:hypothetical protein
MKKNTPVELPFVVSVRFSDPDFRRLVVLANTGRRTLSQTLRLLLEPVLNVPPQAA